IHKIIKQNLQNKLEAEKQYWQDLLNNEEMFMQLRETIISEKLGDINNSVDTFKNRIISHMTIIGQSIDSNFIAKLTQAQSLLNSVNFGSITPPAVSNGGSSGSVYNPSNEFEKNIIAEMKDNGAEWHFANDAKKEELNNINEQ